MSRSIVIFLVCLLVLCGLVAPLRAAVISGTFSGDATLTPTGTPGVFAQNFTGDGDDTMFGSFTPQSHSTVDFSHPPSITISNGMLSETFAQGVLNGTSSGDGTVSGQGTAMFSIDFVITGGTGVFMGATGNATLTGMITRTSATTESISGGTYTGSITLVPEPPGATLLATGGLIFLGLVCRRSSRQCGLATAPSMTIPSSVADSEPSRQADLTSHSSQAIPHGVQRCWAPPASKL